MNAKIMNYVLMVAEEKSFSKAAKRLFLSQPSLSQSISALEKQIGILLFDRSTMPLALTFAGEKFVEYAEKMLTLQHELDMQMADIAGDQIGQLNIGISLFRNSTILTRIFPVFHKIYPNVRLVVKEAINQTVVDMALSGQADISFVNGAPPADLQCVDLLTDNVLLAVGKDHPICQKYDFESAYPQIDLRLFEDDYFSLTPRHSNLRSIADEIFTDYGMKPKIAVETYSLELAHKFAMQNATLAIIFDSLLCLFPKDQRARYFRFDRRNYTNKLFLCYKKNRIPAKILSNFIRITKDVVERQKSDPIL